MTTHLKNPPAQPEKTVPQGLPPQAHKGYWDIQRPLPGTEPNSAHWPNRVHVPHRVTDVELRKRLQKIGLGIVIRNV